MEAAMITTEIVIQHITKNLYLASHETFHEIIDVDVSLLGKLD
jgi:hypothetical protein